MPSVSPPAAPAAACRCRQAAAPGSWASAPSGRAPVHRRLMPSTPAAPLLRLTCASAFLRLSRSTIASIDGQPAARLSTSVLAARASVPSAPALRASPLAPARKVSSSSVFCRMARARSPLYLPFHRSGLRRVAPPTMPSADFCAAISDALRPLSPDSRTRRRPPEVRSTAFAARPPDLPPRSLMTVDFAIICSLVRPGRPRYPVLVHRAAALLHASFRPRLAMTPLRFANPSPPSGWIEDFHLQAVDHARHTEESPGVAGASECGGSYSLSTQTNNR